MNINKIINKKNNHEPLSYEELSYAFNSYLNNTLNDTSMTKLLHAIVDNDCTDEEIIDLTDIFIKSGKTLSFNNLPTCDKHSTGGIGDKTSLIIGPLCASLHVYVPKMSGRGLGITGGTIDKLESIPGFNTTLSLNKFTNLVKKNYFALISQSEEIVPMDKKIYALRDITNTTKSIPLIASSIMSKKIACGANNILIDIKVGKGALINDIASAKRLSKIMIKIGKKYNRKVKTIISNMDHPLGNNIGNALEILEVLDVLNNKGNKELTNLCLKISTNMCSMTLNKSKFIIRAKLKRNLKNGTALKNFLHFVKEQNGDIKKLSVSKKQKIILSFKNGIIYDIDAYLLGKLVLELGAGRINKKDKIDHQVGAILHKKIGDKVTIGSFLFTIYGDKIKIPKYVNDIFKIR